MKLNFTQLEKNNASNRSISWNLILVRGTIQPSLGEMCMCNVRKFVSIFRINKYASYVLIDIQIKTDINIIISPNNND